MMKTDKRVAILHIGQNKTGSTSIQHAIAGYDDGSTFTATFKESNHSFIISNAFRGNFLNSPYWKNRGVGGEELRRRREQYRAEFSAMLERRDRNRIIVTGENIWHFGRADKAELVEFIRRRGWEVRVVAYVREPAGFAASMLSNRIRDGAGPNLPCKPIKPKYRVGLEAFAELLPPENLHVRPFDLARLEGGHPVSDFCKTVDLDLSGAEAIHANRNLSLPAMKLLHRFNGTGILDRYDSELVAARKWFAQMVRDKYAGSGMLDPALCEGIADWSDTEWLYENFGIDFRPQKPPPPAADLEGVLSDLSDVDLSGLDECLAEYGIAGENFATAEEKLQRLFYIGLTLEKGGRLFKAPGRNLAKSFHYRALKRLSKSRLLSPSRRGALTRKAHELRDRWIAKR